MEIAIEYTYKDFTDTIVWDINSVNATDSMCMLIAEGLLFEHGWCNDEDLTYTVRVDGRVIHG